MSPTRASSVTRRPHPPGLTRVLSLAVASVTATAGIALAAPSASASAHDSTSSMESQFIADTNAARNAHGQSGYAVASDLTAIARRWAAHMAAQGSISHNPNLTSQVADWQAVGENVGVGPDVQDIQNAFMNSPEHRSNILDHDFTQVGVGVVWSNNEVWVVVDFRQPMHASTAMRSQHHRVLKATTVHKAKAHRTHRTHRAHKHRTARRLTSAQWARMRVLKALLRARRHGPIQGVWDPLTQTVTFARLMATN